jgi:hypothetical protein
VLVVYVDCRLYVLSSELEGNLQASTTLRHASTAQRADGSAVSLATYLIPKIFARGQGLLTLAHVTFCYMKILKGKGRASTPCVTEQEFVAFWGPDSKMVRVTASACPSVMLAMQVVEA